MRKILSKLDMIYKKSETFVDFLYKIVFSIISIFILINANKLTKEQVKLNKSLTSPTFVISSESYADDKVKVKNIGGKVSHVFVERIDEIYVRYRNKNILISIRVNNSTDLPENEVWHFTPNSKKYNANELYQKINSSIKDKHCIQYVLPPLTYYKITYMDYQNTYNEDYYSLYGEEGKYSKDRSELDKSKFIYNYNFFISDDDYLDVTYENILSSLNQYIDYYNNKERTTNKTE